MPEQPANPFMIGGRFAANPQLYDYAHTLTFDPAGVVEMVDGAGQALNTLVRGKFTVEETGLSSFALAFTELVDIDPYYKHKRFHHLEIHDYVKAISQDIPYDEQDVRRRMAPCRIPVTREEGIFPLRQQVIWKIKDAQEWPYRLYRVRYHFATDPLATCLANRKGILYYSLKAPEPDTTIYYRNADEERFTAGELRQAGIAVDEE